MMVNRTLKEVLQLKEGLPEAIIVYHAVFNALADSVKACMKPEEFDELLKLYDTPYNSTKANVEFGTDG